MNKLQNYVVWLDGFLTACDGQMNISKTNVIKNKLNDLFEHEAEKLSDKTNEKKSLEEFGKELGFPVYEGFPPKNHGLGYTDEKGVTYRC